MIARSIPASCSAALAVLLAPGAAFAQALPENDPWWVRTGNHLYRMDRKGDAVAIVGKQGIA